MADLSPTLPPAAITLQCDTSRHLAIKPAKVWKGGDSYCDCSSALHDSVGRVKRDQRGGSQRRPRSCEHGPPTSPAELTACLLSCLPACLRPWLNLIPPPQASRHITLGFYYSPASQHTESHVKAGHKPPRLAVPFLPLHSAFSPVNAIRLYPAAQSLSRTFSCLFIYTLPRSFSPHVWPLPPVAPLSLPPCPTLLPSQPRSPPITAPLILREQG